MKNKFLTLTLGVALGMSFALPQLSNAQGADANVAPAQQSCGNSKQSCESGQCSVRRAHRHEGGGRRAAWKQIQSSLTPEQQKQLGDIRSATKEQVSPLFDQMKGLKDQLSQLPKDDPKAQTQRDLLIGQMKDLRSQIRESFKASREKSLAILTPEQRAQLKASRQATRQNGGQDQGVTQ